MACSSTNLHEATENASEDQFTDDEHILVIGNWSNYNSIYATPKALSTPITNLQPPPYRLDEVSACLYGDNTIVVTGDSSFSECPPLVLMLNVQRNHWSRLPSPDQRARSGLEVVVVSDNLFAVGGQVGWGLKQKKWNKTTRDDHPGRWVDRYNPETAIWDPLPSVPIKRSRASTVKIISYKNALVALLPKREENGGTVQNAANGAVYIMDTSSNNPSWTMPTAGSEFDFSMKGYNNTFIAKALVLEDDRILLSNYWKDLHPCIT